MSSRGDLVAYLGTVATTAVAIGALVVAARRAPTSKWLDVLLKSFAVVLLVAWATWWIYLFRTRSWNVDDGIPLQLCDAATIVAAAALWWRHWLLVELTYFWGLAGTLQAVITPGASGRHFPDFFYFQHYLTHGGVVLAGIVLVFGLGIHPRRFAVPRMIVATLALVLVAALVDVTTGADYMFLRYPPSVSSLFNLLGGWPRYLFTGAAVAILFFAVLDLPFWRERRRLKAGNPG